MARMMAVSAPHHRTALQRSTCGDAGSCERGTRARHEDDRHHHDGHVHEEDRSPPEVREQEAPDDRTDRGHEPGDPRPDRDRLATLVLREDVAEHRQGRRHRARATDAHRAPRDRQPDRGRRERGRSRRDAEDDQADQEEALAAAPVAHHRERQEQAREHEAVRRCRSTAGRPRWCGARIRCSGTRPRGSCCRSRPPRDRGTARPARANDAGIPRGRPPPLEPSPAHRTRVQEIRAVATNSPVVPSMRPTSVTCGPGRQASDESITWNSGWVTRRRERARSPPRRPAPRAARRRPRPRATARGCPRSAARCAASTSPPRTTATPPPDAITVLAASAMSSGSRPNTTRLCVSCATVVATAPVQSPQPDEQRGVRRRGRCDRGGAR